MENKPQQDTQDNNVPITKVANFVVLSALDLQTAFGIGPLLQQVCLHFEPKVQAHLGIIHSKLEQPVTTESLSEVLTGLTLLPDDFLTETVEYIDKQAYPLPIRAIVAYDYMAMIASAMEREVRKSATKATQRIMQSGIVTTNDLGGGIIS